MSQDLSLPNPSGAIGEARIGKGGGEFAPMKITQSVRK